MMRIAKVTLLLSLLRQSNSFVPAVSPLLSAAAQICTVHRLAATPAAIENEQTTFWQARQDCWRPDVRDVEKISWGMPAKKKRTGSRGVPHRLNEDERRSFDQARKQGFLQGENEPPR